MRRSHTFLLVAALAALPALAASACGGTADDETGDVVVGRDAETLDPGIAPDGDVAPNGDDARPPSDDDADDVPGDVDDTPDDADDADDAPEDAADDDASTIPARFHGEWNADLASCGTGSSESRLRISGDRIRFYESVGVVRAVDIESARVIEVTAEYTGEGQTWRDERRLTLSADGDRLTVSGGAGLVRYRCP